MPIGRVEHMTLYHRNLPPSVIPASKHFLRRQDGQFFLLSLSMVQSFLLAQRYFCFPERRNRQRLWLSLSLLAARAKLHVEQSRTHHIYTEIKNRAHAHTLRTLQLEGAVNVTSHSDRSQPSVWALWDSQMKSAEWNLKRGSAVCVCVL